MDLRLKGKRALVTGSSAGIGAAIAQSLAHEGVSVVIHGRNPQRADRVARDIRSAGGVALVVLGDLTRDADARHIIDKALTALGDIDILVNNAGSFRRRSWLASSSHEWLRTYDANVISMVRIIRGVIPHMRLLGWGRIIQISSRAASYPLPQMPDYAASKAAIVNLTVSLSKELAGTGISVNCVSPGIILTPRVERSLQGLAKRHRWGADLSTIEKRALEKWNYDYAKMRLGRVDDVANIVTFLSSPISDYINGANIRVDGGGTGTVT